MELLFILIFISNLLSIIVGEDQYIAIPFDSKQLQLMLQIKIIYFYILL